MRKKRLIQGVVPVLLGFLAFMSCTSDNTTATPPTLKGLKVQFVNNTGLHDSLVFITIQNASLGSNQFNMAYSSNGTNTSITFASNSDLMSQSISLHEVDSNIIYVDSVISGIFFVSYGQKLTSTTSAPSYIGSGGADYYTPFQNFELTRVGNNGDQGDLTAINYFTAPMSITSYGANGDTLQSKGYVIPSDSIRKQLIAITNGDSSAVITSKDGLTYLRIIGPSSFSATQSNPYPTFVSYLNAIATAGDTAIIQNHNAFVDTAKNPNNYDYRLNFKATVKDTTITMLGSIDVYETPYGGTTSLVRSFDSASVSISCPSDSTGLLDFVIYGQVIHDNVTFNSKWGDLKQYMDSVSMANTSAFSITKNLAIGELTTGLLLGLINSDSLSPGGDTIKTMASDDWWKMSPMKAFSDAQSNVLYYNQYANVIYKASNNEVYSIPYSDRLGKGPLVNSVYYNGTPVHKWVVTLDPPLGKVSQ